MDKEIDFFTFLTKGSAPYAEFLRESCEKLKSGDVKINYKAIESLNIDRFPEGYEIVAKSGDAGHNSTNHALALNESLKHITSDYAVLIDSDVAITYKGWDKVIISELEDKECWGFSYHHKEPKYQNFPTVYLFALKKELLKAPLDFKPIICKDSEKPFRAIITEGTMNLYNLPNGSQLKCDTGFDLPRQVKNAGFDGSGIKCVFGNEKGQLLPFTNNKNKSFCLKKPTHMCEWHYKGKLFGSHKQASRNHPIDGKWGKAWTDRINLYLK